MYSGLRKKPYYCLHIYTEKKCLKFTGKIVLFVHMKNGGCSDAKAQIKYRDIKSLQDDFGVGVYWIKQQVCLGDIAEQQINVFCSLYRPGIQQ